MNRSRISRQLKNELREAASRITNVAELRAYAEKFPSPQAGQIIIEALDFLSEPKVVRGKRDGRKIYKHVDLGYGPRLKKDQSLLLKSADWLSGKMPGRDIIIAIGLYAEREWPKKHGVLPLRERIDHKKFFGSENPQDLVYEFLNLLSNELRRRL